MTYRASSPPSEVVRQFVLKVHGLCNLACDHCYVYEHADQTWRDRPAFMTPATVRRAAERIADHAARHRLDTVGIVLHGGEPLLLGPDRLEAALTAITSVVGAVTRIDWRMQTNGILLTDRLAEILLAFGVKVGVSLDGGREANDRHRRYQHGGGSFDATVRGISLLRQERYRPVYAGILCTVDVANDPDAVYTALLEQQPPRLDFLLPHATWETPPPRPAGAATPYADWLNRIRTRWLADGRPVPIRLFDSLEATAAGGDSETESVGGDRGDLAVIETDGSWEQPDSMKTTFDGAAATGLSVFTASADDLLRLPVMRQRTALSATCRACPVVTRCGGGLYAHRYRHGNGFDNPSVYCADLKELIVTMDSLPLWVVGRLSGGDAVTALSVAQESFVRALLVTVADSCDDGPAADAWDLLEDLDTRFPDAVRQVVAHPFLRVWAIRRLRENASAGRLADLAAAVLVTAGDPAEVVVTPRDGRVHLPALGTVTLPGAPDRAVISGAGTVRWDGGTARLEDGDPRWRPAPVVDLGDLVVRLEDADPYRDCHDWPAAPPLSAEDVRSWTRALTGAWQVIKRDAPGQVEGLVRGLRAIVPLVPAADATLRSATSRHAFGAVGIAATDDPEALAVLLVHEFQHSKLAAVLDEHDLLDPRIEATVRVAWRSDPRPPEGVLQGIYAHLAVADMWRHRPGAAAAEIYASYRNRTTAAIDALRGTGALAPLGQSFVDGIAAEIASWR
ncbi:FxsB family cyclophane-forming radical SAM/SPASM peptide maturase [Actinoplanes rectilineatus]|uniref:FxsB family cyclophane-forming radical SAM/SPASM peptide maturase n=1 Tax=Actinoplanes rectilineatus TaxID=113571 RepID=UPI0005F294C6|nr:FxsB family cyclophane-forming radical SAM/SPASM peptide maturase [Actinoplanes rectilineatus]